MNEQLTSEIACDPAAIYCMTRSLMDQLQINRSESESISGHYEGWDNAIRECVRVSTMFERWCCQHIDFDEFNGVWPYEMEDKFGEAVFEHQESKFQLESFSEHDCGYVASILGLKLGADINSRTPANSIFTIMPYDWNGTWVFDDDEVGLKREAFVSGADTFIDKILEQKGIEGRKGFVLQFSATEFPDTDAKLTWVAGDINNVGATSGNTFGNDYVHEESGHQLWLCPALFKYFSKAPSQMFVKVSEKPKTKKKGKK